MEMLSTLKFAEPISFHHIETDFFPWSWPFFRKKKGMVGFLYYLIKRAMMKVMAGIVFEEAAANVAVV